MTVDLVLLDHEPFDAGGRSGGAEPFVVDLTLAERDV